MNSPMPHFPTHFPLSHTCSPGHCASWSMTPSQSLSRPSQISALGLMMGRQLMFSPAEHCVTPFAHTPCIIVSQGTPPPLQVMPLT